MQPLDPEAEALLREWIGKADADLEVARRIAAEAAGNLRIREIPVPYFELARISHSNSVVTMWRTHSCDARVRAPLHRTTCEKSALASDVRSARVSFGLQVRTDRAE